MWSNKRVSRILIFAMMLTMAAVLVGCGPAPPAAEEEPAEEEEMEQIEEALSEEAPTEDVSTEESPVVEETEEPVFSDTEVNVPDSSWCKSENASLVIEDGSDERLKAEGESYIANEVILAGTRTDIEIVAGQFELVFIATLGPAGLDGLEETVTPEETGELTGGPFSEDVRVTFGIPDELPYQDFEFQLFYTDREDIRILVAEIYDSQSTNAIVLDRYVFAEPNYIVANPWGVEISPWGVEISPWGVEISPWGVEISPDNPEESTGAESFPLNIFWQQWALHDEYGIGILTGHDPVASRHSDYNDGEGFEIAVFDTSPVSPGYLALPTHRDQIYMELCVSQIGSANAPAIPTSKDVSNNYLSSHGLFVSGLAHAVAPASHISLIKVLNDKGVGDLATLIAGLNWYRASKSPLSNTVINLSLGFEDTNDGPPQASKIAIQNMRNAGAVIVAAAGNDGGNTASNAPAIWPMTVGVGANDMDRNPTCYSNNAEIYAPSGNGDDACMPNWDSCGAGENANPDCEYGVVSLIAYSDTEFGLAFWAGTSFSTPLVSGMASLLTQNGSNDVQADVISLFKP